MSQLNTSITAVTVYNDRARITRRGVQGFDPGVQYLELPHLPISLYPESVRVSSHGTAQARLLGLQLNRTFYVDPTSEKVQEIEEQIDALDGEKLSLETQVDREEQAKNNLTSLIEQSDTFAIALVTGEMSLESQLTLFDQVHERIAAVDDLIHSLLKQQRDVERQLEKLKNELQQLHSAEQRAAYTAKIGVEVLSAGELTFDLTYVIRKAGWEPIYDFRLLDEDTDPSVTIGYMAQVNQQSGEDWQDVDLTLSTARPSMSEILPELKPWYIQPIQPPVPLPVKAQSRDVRKKSDEDAVVTPASNTEQPIPHVKADMEISGSAITYKVPTLTTIPSDGSPHKVTISRIVLEAKLDYLTAPKSTEAVYRRARLVNDSPYTMLAGALNIFTGDAFVGTTQMELIAPQGEFELIMGADDRIKVSRELRRRQIDKKIIGGKRRLYFSYMTELENLLPIEAVITLNDQIPVSRHEDVKVNLEPVDPPYDERTDMNLLTWLIKLGPGEKHAVRLDFSVEYPPDMNLVGLP